MKPLSMTFSPFSCHVFAPNQYIFFSTLLSKTPVQIYAFLLGNRPSFTPIQRIYKITYIPVFILLNTVREERGWTLGSRSDGYEEFLPSGI
jgi:hypothetical protein